MVSLKNLQAFITVVEEKSFTKAAEALYLTQPALSKQVRVLENYLGVELLERGEKELLLTEEGRLFYPEAKSILDHFAAAAEKVKEHRIKVGGKLLLGASTFPGEYLLPEVIGRFCRLYPDLKIELLIGDTGEIINLLKNRTIPLGFIGALPEKREKSIIVDFFRQDELILIIPPGSGLYKTEGKPDLAQLIVRERGSGTRKIVEDFLSKAGCWPAEGPKMELGTTRAVISSIAAGLGVGFVSRYAAEEALALGRIREGKSPLGIIERPIYLAALKGRPLSLNARTFRDFALNRP